MKVSRISGYLLLLALAAGCSGVDNLPTTAATAPVPAESVAAPMAEADEYVRACGICHLETGSGVPGAFPPLDAGLQAVATSDAGRNFLVGILHNGLYGPISVNGTNYNGAMPPQNAQLTSTQLAGLLNYVLATFAETPGNFTSAEVETRAATVGTTAGAVLRQRAYSPSQNNEARQQR